SGGAPQTATSRWAFGAVGLSLPGDDVAAALALAHEVQHAKLCALMDLLPLVTDRGQRLYYAPWRPDPRPLASLLHGLYAHLGVTRFWRRQREVAADPAEAHQANVEFARWRSACARVATVVAGRPELTAPGVVFVEAATRPLRRWRREPVPRAAREEARRAAAEHRGHWEGFFRMTNES
ncbi:MAG: HEXXH motif domain-containing protein, partial [Nocardiopsaceae bacterium]|nr:HEXXH motif domain-containing protein [Nocardiopsaceae bacterium]